MKKLLKLVDIIPDEMVKIGNAVREKNNVINIRTGFQDFDKILKGMQGGEIYIIRGKNFVLVNDFIENLIIKIFLDANILLYTYTYEVGDRVLRLLAKKSHIQFVKLKKGKFTDAECQDIIIESDNMANVNLKMGETENASMEDFNKQEFKANGISNLNLLIIDSVTKINGFDIKYSFSEFKKFAEEMNIPIVIIDNAKDDNVICRDINTIINIDFDKDEMKQYKNIILQVIKKDIGEIGNVEMRYDIETKLLYEVEKVYCA